MKMSQDAEIQYKCNTVKLATRTLAKPVFSLVGVLQYWFEALQMLELMLAQ